MDLSIPALSRFDEAQYNESEFADAVAKRYNTNHYVETVKSSDFDLIDTLAHLYDEPYADSSAIPTYRVCQLARRRSLSLCLAMGAMRVLEDIAAIACT